MQYTPKIEIHIWYAILCCGIVELVLIITGHKTMLIILDTKHVWEFFLGFLYFH